MVFLIFRAHRLADRIFCYNYFIEVLCFYYSFKYIYILIPFLFIKYKRCTRLNKKNYIVVSWEAVNRIMDSTIRQIEKEERKQKRTMKQTIKYKARIDRLRKTLKLIKQRLLAQVKYLFKQLDEKIAARKKKNENRVIDWKEFNI